MINILIADDYSMIRHYIKLLLIDAFEGVVVDEVSDTEALLKKIKERDWDMLITDLSMPGISVIDALGQIKLLNPNLPVIVLSAHPEEEFAVTVLAAGASGYLSKESPSEVIIQTIREFLHNR